MSDSLWQALLCAPCVRISQTVLLDGRLAVWRRGRRSRGIGSVCAWPRLAARIVPTTKAAHDRAS